MTFATQLLFPTESTRAINSTIVPCGIGVVKSILSVETVTTRLREKRVAQIKEASSIS